MKKMAFIAALLGFLLCGCCFQKKLIETRIRIPKDVLIAQQAASVEILRITNNKTVPIIDSEMNTKGLGTMIALAPVFSDIFGKIVEGGNNSRRNMVEYKVIIYDTDVTHGTFQIQLPNQTIVLNYRKDTYGEAEINVEKY